MAPTGHAQGWPDEAKTPRRSAPKLNCMAAGEKNGWGRSPA
jgi:hypothetical protein